MKYIFSILLIFSFNLSFGQMTPSEMMKIYKMDFDQFETYSIGKGYKFDNLKNDEYRYGHCYTKGNRYNTKYLTLCNPYFDEGVKVTYQTSNSNEYLNFKNQMIKLGFVLYSKDDFNDEPYKVYRNNKYQIYLFTMKDNIFEISLSKY